MISAKQARERAKEIKDRDEKQKELVETKVMESIEHGQTFCWLGIRVSTNTKEWLKALGYVVRIERITRSEKTFDTHVSW